MPYFTRALKMSPRDTLAYAYRGRTYYLQNKLQPSLTDLDAGLRVDPADALLHWIRGNTEWASGLLDSAVEDYAAAGQEEASIKGYMTVLSVLAAGVNHDPQRAKSLLAACTASCQNTKVIQREVEYLQGTFTGRDLINTAGNLYDRADAHAIVGYSLLLRGKTAEARTHFTWIIQHAAPTENWRPIVRVQLAKMR